VICRADRDAANAAGYLEIARIADAMAHAPGRPHVYVRAAYYDHRLDDALTHVAHENGSADIWAGGGGIAYLSDDYAARVVVTRAYNYLDLTALDRGPCYVSWEEV